MTIHVDNSKGYLKVDELRLYKQLPSSLSNGDFWVASNRVYVRTNSTTKDLTDVGAGGGAFTADGSFAAFQGGGVDAGAGSTIGALAQGSLSTASGIGTFAQGSQALASGSYGGFAQGRGATASGLQGCFAQGYNATAVANGAFAQGSGVIANGLATFAQGAIVTAGGSVGVFAQGTNCSSGSIGSFAQGFNCSAATTGAFAQGTNATASGNLGCFAQGSLAIASGAIGCFAQGNYVTASANSAWASGLHCTADKIGQFARSSGRFSAAGDAQASQFILRRATTDATANVELFLDGSSARMVIPNNTTWGFRIMLIGRRTTASAENSSMYVFTGLIEKDATAGSTNMINVNKEVIWEEHDTDAVVDADTTNAALRIRVTGIAAVAINWVAHVQTVETTG